MNAKLLTMSLVLATLLVMPYAISAGAVTEGSGSVNFQVDILMDTTISMPSPICENGGNVSETLEFQIGIDGIESSYSRPIDGCGDGTYGDYNITNDGNVPVKLAFSINSDAPQGLTMAIGNSLTYSAANYLNLSATPSIPTWASQSTPLSPTTGSDVLQLWQRIAADDTASGSTQESRTITITSTKYDLS